MQLSKNSRTPTIKKALREIDSILKTAEKYKSCFFWTQTGSASQRRSQEFEVDNSFNFNNKSIEVNQTLSISCKNFYFTNYITVNGDRKDIRAIKKLKKELEAILSKRKA